MKSRINHSSHLIDFLVDDFDYEQIDKPLKKIVDLKLKKYNIPELKEWTVEFLATYGNLNKIVVYRQARSQSDMKYKQIIIHIPIPLKDIVFWGVNENQTIKLNSPSENCELIDIKPENYSNKYDFIIECMKKGIDHTFDKVFTVNKIKIKAST